MGWAKYDEDNRDYIEERCSLNGNFPTVFNYTASYWSKQKNERNFSSQCSVASNNSCMKNASYKRQYLD